jgi:hypothetical protein
MAMKDAEEILGRADTKRVASDLRARVYELAEALFQSIRMQLSVPRYRAISVDRGATLDTVEVPLNNRRWLVGQFQEIRKLEGEFDRLRGIEALLNWTNPGPGGFYDNLGDPTRRPHLVRGEDYAKDPAFYQSPLTSFGYRADWRLSWCRHAQALFDAPLRMRYTNLDPGAEYKVRILYAGDNFRPSVRLVANDAIEIHPLRRKDAPLRPVEFDFPKEATSRGELRLTWYAEPGRGGNGRGCDVAEVWLIRK